MAVVAEMVKSDVDEMMRLLERYCVTMGFASWCGYDVDGCRDILRAALMHDDVTMLVAREECGIVGFIGGVVAVLSIFGPTKILEEYVWWVVPEKRRNGVGKALVDEIETWGRGRGAKSSVMTAFSSDDDDATSAMLMNSGYGLLERRFHKELGD